MKNYLSIIVIFIYTLFAFGSMDSNKEKSNDQLYPSSQPSQNNQKSYNDCNGSENCITKVRNNFMNTGKQILGEQYLGNGKFGISFLDVDRGAVYNANVTTNCNCEIKNVRVNIVR